MSEENIPIDIHYNKLLDWLVNRRHCDLQWQSTVLEVRQKINTAIQDMPEHPEITKLLTGTYINYFHCIRIIEILRETEVASKNIFGRYSSQRMKDWQEIVKLYEKNSIYLAEAAQLLTRNVNFEIPTLKRQLAKCQEMGKECSRKEGEYASLSTELIQKYQKQCKDMGIEGKKIKTELMALVKDLPATYDRLAESTKGLQSAVELYSNFVSFTLAKTEFGDDCLRLLKYVVTHGNASVYEWTHGTKPTEINLDALNYNVSDEEDDNVEIVAEEIDWGNLDSTADGIDFGAITLEDGAANELNPEGAGEVDWGDLDTDVHIEVVEDTSTPQSADTDRVAKGVEAMSLLDNPQTRVIFVNELIELESFLEIRVQEMKSDGDNILSSSQFQNAPASLQVEISQVEEMKNHVHNILNELTSTKMQDLMLIRSSPRYVERLKDKLKKTMTDSEKMLSMSRLMVTRRAEAQEEESQVQPQIQLFREKMKELKLQIEKEISKKYKNRRVNIMGEINTV